MLLKAMNLDSRLQQAVAQMGLVEATPIQEKGIPLALDDRKDVVAMAPTGSGKTIAYLLPILQQLLDQSQQSTKSRALIVVPSRELADQVYAVIAQLTIFASKSVQCVNLAQQVSEKVKTTLLASNPHIVIATPATVRVQLEAGRFLASDIGFVVFDEADLLMSYGYEDDLKALHEIITGHCQTWIMSATLGEDTDQLKKWFCHMPVTLKLQEAKSSEFHQYFVKCSELDKFLLTYVIFKLGLIKGKTIVFVNEIDRGYRLKLFLQQFGVKAAVLNSELPVASRLHIVHEFDRNVYNLLIATDESHLNATRGKNGEYSVSRGVDFKNVACVLNFDLPISSKAYTHRIGRTARASQSGMALSFVVPKSEFGQHKIATCATARRDEKILARVQRAQEAAGAEMKPYLFDMDQVNSFRYRMEDAFRAVTRTAVRQARTKELREEILTSEKLQRHFEENPDDLALLRHDRELHSSRIQNELRHVPEYLLPASAHVTKPLIVQPTHDFRKQFRKRHGIVKKKMPRKRRDPLRSFGR